MKTRLMAMAYVLVTYGVAAANHVASADGCATLRAALATPITPLPRKTLTQAEKTAVDQRRACIKGYSAGFPGGKEAFLTADAATLRDDLRHVEQLFAYAAKNDLASPAAEALDPSGNRTAHILGGWDREQVLLWGGFFYMRRLYEEEQLDALLDQVNRIRSTFGIRVTQLSYWDDADEATYFSTASLRDMLRLLELNMAAVRELSAPPAQQRAAGERLAGMFVAERQALSPFFKVVRDPSDHILQLCSASE